MGYATRGDMAARYGAVEMARLLEAPDGAEDAGRAEAALADAAAEVDAALAESYELPLPSGAAYPLLTAIACDLARQRLYDDAPTEAVSNRARRSRVLLQELAGGVRKLLAKGGGVMARRAVGAARVGPAPVMTPENLRGL